MAGSSGSDDISILTLRHAGTDSPARALLLELCAVPRTLAKPRTLDWQITRVAKRAVYVGEVQAADPAAAIKRAIEKYDIAAEHHDRLAARPITRASQP